MTFYKNIIQDFFLWNTNVRYKEKSSSFLEMRFVNNETLRNFSWIFFYVSLWKHAFSFLLLPFCSPSNTSSSSTFGSKFTTFGRFFTYTTAATTKSTKNYKSSHHAAHFPFVLEYIKIKGSLDKSDERRTLSWGAKCYILVVQIFLHWT